MLQRRTPLARSPISRRSPLKQRKPLSRGRRARPTAEEQAHLARVATMPCLVSGERPVTVHHVTASIHGGRMARSHFRIVPLAARFHLIQRGPRWSVEALGHGGFYDRYGIDLLAEAERIWREAHD